MNRMHLTAIVFFGFNVLVGAAAQAVTLDVCSATCTYADIQSAVDAAAPGDVIDIAAVTSETRAMRRW